MRVFCVYRAAFCLAVAGALLTGCNDKVQGTTAPEPKPADTAADAAKKASDPKAADDTAVIPVQAAKPKQSDISEYFETTTRVLAERHVEVLAEGVGQCLSVGVEEGDAVKKGQVLAQLDRKELEAALGQSQVNVQQTKYQMEKAREQHAKGILSAFEAENAKFVHEQSVAAVNVQQVRISKQTITAPIDGVVTKRNLQPGQMVAAGVPAFSIVDPASYILPINPPEKELARLKVGQEAKVSIDAMPGQEITATVRRINPAVDPLSGTIKVTLDFGDADRAVLREAAFARVRLIMTTHENALLVPKDVIIEENARRFLMVLNEKPGKDGKPQLVAERREIRTGLQDSNQVEVTEGVDAETLVVTLGQQTLKAGSVVSVTTTDEAIAAVEHKDAKQAIEDAEKKEEEKTGQGGGKRRVGAGVNRNQLH